MSTARLPALKLAANWAMAACTEYTLGATTLPALLTMLTHGNPELRQSICVTSVMLFELFCTTHDTHDTRTTHTHNTHDTHDTHGTHTTERD